MANHIHFATNWTHWKQQTTSVLSRSDCLVSTKRSYWTSAQDVTSSLWYGKLLGQAERNISQAGEVDERKKSISVAHTTPFCTLKPSWYLTSGRLINTSTTGGHGTTVSFTTLWVLAACTQTITAKPCYTLTLGCWIYACINLHAHTRAHTHTHTHTQTCAHTHTHVHTHTHTHPPRNTIASRSV